MKISEGTTFRLNKYMSRMRFEGVISSLNYTDRKGVEYNDGFFNMRQMEEACNINMSE